MDRYISLWKTMEKEKYYTAKELNVAPATMTALINRKLAVSTDTSPRKYKKIDNMTIAIADILENNRCEYFTLYKENKPIGMMCSFANGKIVDCFGNDYDLTGVKTIQIKNKKLSI